MNPFKEAGIEFSENDKKITLENNLSATGKEKLLNYDKLDSTKKQKLLGALHLVRNNNFFQVTDVQAFKAFWQMDSLTKWPEEIFQMSSFVYDAKSEEIFWLIEEKHELKKAIELEQLWTLSLKKMFQQFQMETMFSPVPLAERLMKHTVHMAYQVSTGFAEKPEQMKRIQTMILEEARGKLKDEINLSGVPEKA